VHHYGEEKEKGKGLEDMKTIVGEVTGVPVHYVASIDFAGFKQLIDAIGGVEITLNQPFEEAMQFNEPHVCDSFFTVPTGEYENKTVKFFSKETQIYRTRVVASYPLCSAPKINTGNVEEISNCLLENKLLMENKLFAMQDLE